MIRNGPTLIDLFCGAGGISHGFEQVGFSILAGLDFDKDSVATFEANHIGAKAMQADLATVSPAQLAEDLGVEPGSIDCVAGGPPCQGFSRNRAFRHRDGVFVDDPRNHLYWHFFEYIDYLRPKVVVMENVPEILIKSNGFFKEAVFERFDKLGYQVEAKVLNAAEYGVPQWRRRAIFLAGRERQTIPFPQPTTLAGPRAGRRTPTSVDVIRAKRRPSPAMRTLFDELSDDPFASLFSETLSEGPTVWDAISDLSGEYAQRLMDECGYGSEPSTPYQAERRGDNRRVKNHYRWPLTERQLRRIRLLTEGQGLHHLPDELKTKDGYGSAYRRLQANAQALTLTTWMFHPGSGMFTHPYEDRVLTIREAARVQSFQDDFAFTGRYHSQCRQLGNSVAPLLAQHLARSIAAVLGHTCEPLERELQPSVSKWQ